MQRLFLHAVWIVIAILLLWRLGVVVERSEQSKHWRPEGTAGASSPGATVGTDRGVSVELERLLLKLTNKERQQRGLTPLDGDADLAEISREHSADMLRRGFFDHVTPEGVTPAERIAAGHRTLVGVTGENVWSGSGYIAESTGELAATIIAGWMGSPGHRENILRSTYTHLGVGVAIEGGKILATQGFAEVRAYLLVPLPGRVRSGDILSLDTTPYGDGLRPAELFSLASGDDGGEPRSVTDARVQSVAGSYTLRLYFVEPEEDSYTVYFGPSIVVE